MKQFSQNILQVIESALNLEKKTNPNPVAAFDADGTLWRHDMGEGFFKYQLKRGYIDRNMGDIKDPWQHYQDWKKIEVKPALMWLAQVNRGFSLSQVRAWAEEFVQSITPLDIFPEQRHLIQWLLQKNVRVYVVTASIKWSVEPAAALLNVPFERVLGLKTQVKNDLVSETQDGFITFKEGKSEGLLEATNGVAPFFSCGNSMGDEFLLRCSNSVRLAVRSNPKEHELFETEEKLFQLAQQKDWLTYSF